jgi:uncharacterized membrane protein
MERKSQFKLLFNLIGLGSWVGAAIALSPIHLEPSAHTLQWGQRAEARSSGGRSGGGSSSRSSSPRRVPAQNNSNNYSGGYNRGGGTVIVPVPAPYYPSSGYYNDSNYSHNSNFSNNYPNRSTASSQSGDDGGLLIVGILILMMGVGGIGFVVWLLMKMLKPKPHNPYAEIDNDKVTVTKLQVALLATARSIQKELTDLSLKIDTSNQEGLSQLLQEAALALLRHPEYWTHVNASSETMNSREEAQQRFNQISIAERSKFSVESLVNVGGSRRQQQIAKPSADESAAYIVVTLLLGTANDKPLFETVQTAEALKSTLEAIAAFPSDYLFVVELLWSPQEESDSLTYDELLTEYTEMRQV